MKGKWEEEGGRKEDKGPECGRKTQGTSPKEEGEEA